MRARPTLFAAALLVSSVTVLGADFTIQNTRTPGFSDPTPATPLLLNFGTTRGDQALIVFQAAGALWGATLQSPVAILIDSEFDSVTTNNTFACTADGTVLAYTQPAGYDVSGNFPQPGAGYNIPLANYLTGLDSTPNTPQYSVNINGDLGTSKCDFPAAWYFGLDTQIPDGSISLLTTLEHEFGHGLGFSSLVDPTTGTGSPQSIFDYHIFDVAKGASWVTDTADERKALVLTPESLAFDGPAVEADIPTYLGSPPTLVTTFGGVATTLGFAEGEFSGPLVGSGPIEAAVPLDACSDLTNGDISGKFALIQRSFADAGVVCTFLSKTQRALAAGAAGVIIYDTVDEGLIEMSGTPALSIPATFISRADGATLQSELASGPVTASFGTSLTRSNVDPSGTRVLLYTPSTFRGGSSVIHWNNNSYPHTLMLEYANQADIRLDMDFTPDVMSDLGWSHVASRPVVTGLGISVTKLLDPEIPAGAQSHYLIAIINRRPTAVDNVSLDLAVPAGTTIVSNVSSPAGCATAFPCALGSIPSGGVVLVVTTFEAALTASSPFVATATLTPSTANAGDNLSASSSQSVASGGDLKVTISGPSSFSAGLPASVTTTVTNMGPGDAAGVNLTGTLGGSSAAPPVFAANSRDCVNAFPCALGTVPAGATLTIVSSFNIPNGFQPGSTFTATVSSSTPDSNSSNNTALYTFGSGSSSSGGGGCSSSGGATSVLGLVGVGLALAMRRRRSMR